MALEQLITPDELVEKLATSRKNVITMAGERRIPCVRIGRQIRFRVSEIAAWMEDHAQPAIDD